MKSFFFIFTILFSLKFHFSYSQNEIILYNQDSIIVNFELIQINSENILKSSKGKLKINRINSSAKYRLKFTTDLDEILYHTNLYYENGERLKDKHIKNKDITKSKLLMDKDLVFFLRRRELRLDGNNK
ncbi:MAG: hypothetical protein CMO01_13880 [Thalassobius sp.]|nr:hypothetical protein [Thalassovita sp.]|tara:strand:+ start:207 stop:593 length:387 start_codon:yes stop_codon:yes gene_type:complete